MGKDAANGRCESIGFCEIHLTNGLMLHQVQVQSDSSFLN